MTPERIVLLLSPILVGLSGWIVQLIAKSFPGTPQLDSNELTAIFAFGLLAGITAIFTWSKGRMTQSSDRRLLEINQTPLPDDFDEEFEEFEEADEDPTVKKAK